MKIFCECNNTRCNRKVEVGKKDYNTNRQEGLIHAHKACRSEPTSGVVALQYGYDLYKK